ncbi:MAG: hypothetical protein KDD47_20060, partial [Acidobacteria bacterium]|nr:hypothetical protein [Acidobacteriota bacterium]
ALAAWDRGQDPEPFFRMARSSYAEGLARAPEDAFLLQNLAWTAYFQAKFRVREGRSPEPFLEEAIHRARGADGRASQPGAILCLASAYRIEAEYAVRRGLDPTSALARAGKELQRLLELNPRHAEAHRSLARLETLEGGWRASRGEPAEKALADARRALERALELAPDVASFWLADARWALVAGRSQGGNAAAREVLMQGRASAERALALRPFWAEAEALRGALGMAAEGGAGSGSEGARAELEAALAANPHLRGEWGPLLRVPRR